MPLRADARQVDDLEEVGLLEIDLGALYLEAHLAPDHEVGQRLRVRLGRVHCRDGLALAKYRDSVRDAHDLVELMRDDDDGLAVVAHVMEYGEELFRLLRGQDGGRLVEDEDVRAPVEDLDYLDGLLFGDGHVVYLLRRVELEAVFLGQLAYLLNELAALYRQPALQAERYVLGGREHLDELVVLVDHADAELERLLRRAYRDLLAVYGDAALVGVVYPREDVHQRRLAAPVFAEQREDLPPADIQRDVMVGLDRAEALADALKAYRDLMLQLIAPCSRDFNNILVYFIRRDITTAK